MNGLISVSLRLTHSIRQIRSLHFNLKIKLPIIETRLT